MMTSFLRCFNELFYACIVTEHTLHMCLRKLMAVPRPYHLEAAAFLLSLVDPHIEEHCSSITFRPIGLQGREYLRHWYNLVEADCRHYGGFLASCILVGLLPRCASPHKPSFVLSPHTLLTLLSVCMRYLGLCSLEDRVLSTRLALQP